MNIYIYMYIYICICACIYMYICKAYIYTNELIQTSTYISMYMRGGVRDILMIDSMGKKKQASYSLCPFPNAFLASLRRSSMMGGAEGGGAGGVSVCLHPASVCEVAWALRLRTVMVFFFSKLLS